MVWYGSVWRMKGITFMCCYAMIFCADTWQKIAKRLAHVRLILRPPQLLIVTKVVWYHGGTTIHQTKNNVCIQPTVFMC